MFIIACPCFHISTQMKTLTQISTTIAIIFLFASQISPRDTAAAASTSYQCSRSEIEFQLNNVQYSLPHICADEVWRLVQLAHPQATTFIDIGANRGYTAAKIFNLWSPGHGLTANILFQHTEEEAVAGRLSNSKHLNVFCRDGNREDYPLFCAGRKLDAKCDTRRSIHVYSFDGQLTHANDTRNTAYRYFPYLNPETPIDIQNTHVKATWEYFHTAVTDKVVSEDGKKLKFGYFSKVLHEGGKLVKVTSASNTYTPLLHILVPITTVDTFCDERNIQVVDVLKIDAEGSDVEVIRGSFQTLARRKVKLLTFECFECLHDQRIFEMVKLLDKDFGFDCYIAGLYNIMVRYTNCLDAKLIKPHPCTIYSNMTCPGHSKAGNETFNGSMFCAPRDGPLYHLLEDRSLYQYAHKDFGHVLKDGQLGLEAESKLGK